MIDQNDLFKVCDKITSLLFAAGYVCVSDSSFRPIIALVQSFHSRLERYAVSASINLDASRSRLFLISAKFTP
jgi:hypothetical protein